jgi:protein tyrosine/serine phosphatase
MHSGPIAPTLPRIHDLSGIHNFRDYGAYACNGGRLKSGMLFRSAQHRDATPQDLSAVASLGLEAVIDMRGPAERAAAPCPRPENFAARVIFVDEDTIGQAPHIQAASGAATAAEAHARMVASYAAMPFRPTMVAILRRYFEALAITPGPSLIHCMAGKDRTGIAVALLHEAMGVHRDDTVSDYMLTNVAGRIDQRIEAGARHIRAAFGEDTSDEAIRVLMTVRPEYLQAAFTAIEYRYGSIFVYCRDELGVDDARIDAIACQITL